MDCSNPLIPSANAIYAPLNARPVSDAAKVLVDHLTNLIEEHERQNGTRQRERKSTHRLLWFGVGSFLVDLLGAASDPKTGGWVYRSMAAKGFSGEAVSFRTFQSVLDGLKGLKLITHVPGQARWARHPFNKNASPCKTQGRAAHFRASDALIEKACEFGVRPRDLERHFAPGLPKKPLVLKAASTRDYGPKIAGRRLPIDHTAETRALENHVRRLNEFLDGFDLRGGTHRGFLRIFNEGDHPRFAWDRGGRLYSAGKDSYQHLPSEDRLKMTINGEAVAEIDISASYLTMLHGLLRKTAPPGHWVAEKYHLYDFDPTQDPYAIEGFDRTVVKLWTVATLGAEKHIPRWPEELNRDYQKEHGRKLGEVHSVRSIRQAMEEKYPPVFKGLGSLPVSWADLMYGESEAVIATMTELMEDHKAPSFPVHDSLIVRVCDAEVAQEALRRHYAVRSGIIPQVKIKRGLLRPSVA